MLSNTIFPNSFFNLAIRIDDPPISMYLVILPLSDVLDRVAHGVAAVPLDPVEAEVTIVQFTTGVAEFALSMLVTISVFTNVGVAVWPICAP